MPSRVGQTVSRKEGGSIGAWNFPCVQVARRSDGQVDQAGGWVDGIDQRVGDEAAAARWRDRECAEISGSTLVRQQQGVHGDFTIIVVPPWRCWNAM